MANLSIKEEIEGIDKLINELGENELLSSIKDRLEGLKHSREVKTDFQGWKMNHATLGDLRKCVKNTESLPNETPITVYQDDGMGYGAINGTCTDIYWGEGMDNNDEIKIWF